MSMKKKVIIISLVILALFIFLWGNNNLIQVSKYEYKNSKLPNAFEGYSIVQLSDLHNKKFGVDGRNLYNKVKDLEPDIIVITGDIVDSNRTNISVALDRKSVV